MPDFDDSPLTEEERTFLRELTESGCRFMLVGLAAAVLQGADTTTQDLDWWFEPHSATAIRKAAAAAGGFYSSRMDPPTVGGEGLDRIDIVTHCDGLQSFDEEYENTISLTVDDFELRVLKLERVIKSKEAANRPKDRAVLEQLKATLAASK